MKKRSVLAGAIALGLIMSGCGGSKETEKETSKKTKKTTADESVEVTVDESDETEAEETEPTSDKDAGKDSAKDSDKSTDATSAPAAVSVFQGDPYDFYAGDQFQIPDLMLLYLSSLTSWSTMITMYPESHQFDGEYESRSLALEGDSYEIEECSFSGMIDGFVRVNAYSFSTHVLNLNVEKFDTRQEEYDGLPATVTCGDPYGFTSPDELILYLPNTPLSEVPQEVIEWVEMTSEHPREEYLGDIVLYNPAQGTAFLMVGMAIPETRETTSEELAIWGGSYIDDHYNVKITVDAATASASIQTPDTQYTGLAIRTSLEEGEKPRLLLYGESTDGKYIYALLQVAEGHDNVRVIETNDKTMPGIGDFYLKNA